MAILLDIQTESQPTSEHTIYVNSQIISQLNLPINRIIPIIFGSKKINVYVSVSSSKGKLLILPESIASQLLIPNGIQIHGKYDKEKGLILGPTLGILLQNIYKNHTQEPFGEMTSFLKEIALVSKSKGTLSYAFTLEDIDLQNSSIKGWLLKGNRWEQNKLPIPDVIYNRISSRKFEFKHQESIQQLKSKNYSHFFNDHFLNKWQVYDLLKNTSVQSILPNTKLYKNHTTIKEMLNKYPTSYLKPTNGSLGRGIIKVQKRGAEYFVRLSKINGPLSLNYNSFAQMVKQLTPRLKSEPYIIQEGIDLITIKNRPVDFRILVQKNETGNWAITSMVARVADEQQFVSNLARGGTQSKVMHAIHLSNLNNRQKVSPDYFTNYSLAIAKQIEASSNGSFAELGIDLGLDVNGKLWLLEVNAKPSKNNDPGLTGARPSVHRLIDYTRFLTGLFITKKKKKMKKKPQ